MVLILLFPFFILYYLIIGFMLMVINSNRVLDGKKVSRIFSFAGPAGVLFFWGLTFIPSLFEILLYVKPKHTLPGFFLHIYQVLFKRLIIFFIIVWDDERWIVPLILLIILAIIAKYSIS